jgi:hypothetical protein
MPGRAVKFPTGPSNSCLYGGNVKSNALGLPGGGLIAVGFDSYIRFIKNTLKRFAKRLWLNFTVKLKLILRIISYLTYKCWEIDNFVIKSDIFRRFFICKNILNKLSCYHDNNFKYFMFGKYNGFVSKARVSACMYFLVTNYNLGFGNHWVFIRKQCALTLSYNISTAIFKHQIKQSIEIK